MKGENIMKNIVKRMLVLLLCVSLFIGDNATHIFASEISNQEVAEGIRSEKGEEYEESFVTEENDKLSVETEEDINAEESFYSEEVSEPTEVTETIGIENFDNEENLEQDITEETIPGIENEEIIESEDGLSATPENELQKALVEVNWASEMSNLPDYYAHDLGFAYASFDRTIRDGNNEAYAYNYKIYLYKDGEAVEEMSSNGGYIVDTLSMDRYDCRGFMAIHGSGQYKLGVLEAIYRRDNPYTYSADDAHLVKKYPIVYSGSVNYVAPDDTASVLGRVEAIGIENNESNPSGWKVVSWNPIEGADSYIVKSTIYSGNGLKYVTNHIISRDNSLSTTVQASDDQGSTFVEIYAIPNDITKAKYSCSKQFYVSGVEKEILDDDELDFAGPQECEFDVKTLRGTFVYGDNKSDGVSYGWRLIRNGISNSMSTPYGDYTKGNKTSIIFSTEDFSSIGTYYVEIFATKDGVNFKTWESEPFYFSNPQEKIAAPVIKNVYVKSSRLYIEWKEVEGAEKYSVEIYKGDTRCGIINAIGSTASYLLNEPGEYRVVLRTVPSEYNKYAKSETVEKTLTVTQAMLQETDEYSIYYQLNGGTNNTLNPNGYKKGTSVTFKNPTKSGYTFGGWYDASTDTKVTTVSGRDITVYAQWTPVNYKITYNLNGGTIATTDAKPTTFTIESDEIQLPVPTKKNYSFAGWFTDSKFNNPIEKISTGYVGNVAVFAKWDEVSHNIEFVLNDTQADDAVNSNPDVFYENRALSLKNPVRTGFTFTGFYKADPTDAGFDAKTNKKVTSIAAGNSEDITLYAGWTENNYKVAYNANGGKFDGKLAAETYKYTDDLNIKPADILLERTGYTFEGWNTHNKGTGTDYAPGTSVSRLNAKNGATTTLYAKWSVNEYAVEYELNGGEQPKDKNGNELNPYVHTYVKNAALKNPVRSGYSFAGWFDNENFEGKKLTSISKIDGDVKLYAKWTPVNYKLTYNLNGGKFGKGLQSWVNYNVEFDELALLVPTRTGYNFKGWYADKNFTTEVISIPKGSVGNKAVYARWEGIPYVLSYHLDSDPSGTKKEMTYYYANKYKLATVQELEYDNPGNKLTGWTAEIGGKQKKFANAAAFSNLGTTDNEVIDLYPIWTPITYNVTFNANGGKGTVRAQKVKGDVDFVLPTNTFTKVGFTANGWLVTINGEEEHFDNGTNLGLLTTKDNDKIVIKADYLENDYTVNFVEKGNANAESITVKYTETLTVPVNASDVEGKVFVGWNTKEDGKGTNYLAGQTVSKLVTDGEITIYAKYAEAEEGMFAIAFMANGGSGFVNPVTFKYNTYYALPSKGFTKTGDKLVGWTDDKGNTYKPGEKVRAYKSGDVLVLYAEWKSGEDVTGRPAIDNSPTVKTISDSSLVAGNHIMFGKYEQDGNTSNGQEPIEWEVLEVKNGYATLISKYVLDVKQMLADDRYLDSEYWGNCDIRIWLNSDFANKAFSADEQASIAVTTVNNVYRGSSYGKKTSDKLYLLSAEELGAYYGQGSWKIYGLEYGEWYRQFINSYNPLFLAEGTPYAFSRIPSGYTLNELTQEIYNKENLAQYGYSTDVIGKTYFDYWLRCPGFWEAYVDEFGEAQVWPISNERCYAGVRPTCRIDIATAEELLSE